MKGARRWFTAVILALGTAMFLYLLWSFGPLRVWNHLRGFGWGFAVVLPFQIFDHMLNATGWLFAFTPSEAPRVAFWDLVRVRVAGDGVNYLTPSGNIAGEFVRPGMLRSSLPSEAKVTSVFIAKATQSMGQALFVLFGLIYLLNARAYAFKAGQAGWAAAGMSVILFGVALVIGLFAARPPAWLKTRFPTAVEKTEPVRRNLREYLRRHPGRLAGSILFFMLGYAWGAAEIWLICYFLGFPVGPETALCIEFLSNIVDSFAFLVPAKIGTQEAGKTIIFKGLGLAADVGFTAGLIRHAREMLWAGAGLVLYAAQQRALKKAD
ncbi:MAG: lysylphosphatidylglycerol synthase transmembrane domain-containing protein [Elusimicrobia bacterium]|nr:lysylphosphatidylglycerol synthase transmembrane domain-containing protein [Elusimicrobiota bacterium]